MYDKNKCKFHSMCICIYKIKQAVKILIMMKKTYTYYDNGHISSVPR